MTVEEKIAVCRARYIDGSTMSSIAEEMHITRQAVSAFFRRAESSLPLKDLKSRSKSEHLSTKMPKIKEETLDQFFVLMAENRCTEEELKKIGISPKQATAIFEFMVSNKPYIPSSKNYPELSKWMRENSVYVAQMAKEVGVAKGYFREFLEDKRLMRFENAVRAANITGIPLSKFPIAPWGCGEIEAASIY